MRIYQVTTLVSRYKFNLRISCRLNSNDLRINKTHSNSLCRIRSFQFILRQSQHLEQDVNQIISCEQLVKEEIDYSYSKTPVFLYSSVLELAWRINFTRKNTVTTLESHRESQDIIQIIFSPLSICPNELFSKLYK